MTLQEAEKRLSELEERIGQLLKEREIVLKEWNTAFNLENLQKISCIAKRDSCIYDLYLLNGDSIMLVCCFSDRDITNDINSFYKCIDNSMRMLNLANGRELDSPDYQIRLVHAKAIEIREKFLDNNL